MTTRQLNVAIKKLQKQGVKGSRDDLIALVFSKSLTLLNLQSINEIDRIFNEINTVLAKEIYSYNGYYSAKLKKDLDKLRKSLTAKLTDSSVTQIKAGENLAFNNTELLMYDYLPESVASSWIARNIKLDRSNININMLSARVWEYTEAPFSLIETVLQTGFLKGKPANTIKNEIAKFLINPETMSISELKRMGVDKAGGRVAYEKLKQQIIDYSPGQGVYKSAKANAKRLVVSETNRAYEIQTSKQLKDMPFLRGWKIQISGQQKVSDECNILAGNYPPDFDFNKWHVHCACYKTAILARRDQVADIISGKNTNINPIKTVPTASTNWLSQNTKIFNRIKSQPYWISDNSKTIKKLVPDLIIKYPKKIVTS